MADKPKKKRRTAQDSDDDILKGLMKRNKKLSTVIMKSGLMKPPKK